jgi:hypothetical protein
VPVWRDYAEAAASDFSPNERFTVTGDNIPLHGHLRYTSAAKRPQRSADCVQSTAQEVSATKNGLFQMHLDLTIPSESCSCVVMAVDFSSSTTPITIIGPPVEAPQGARFRSYRS